MSDSNALFARRQRRTRYALRQAAGGRPRLCVFRSGKHIYAQVIDDAKGAHAGRRLVARRGRQGQAQDRRRQVGGGRGRQADRRARDRGRRQGSRVRSRRLPVSRPRQGAGRRRPRGRPVVLTGVSTWLVHPAVPAVARAIAIGTRPRPRRGQRTDRQAGHHQPRRQGGEGRPALRLRRARRGRRPAAAASATAPARRARCRRRSARRPKRPSAA